MIKRKLIWLSFIVSFILVVYFGIGVAAEVDWTQFSGTEITVMSWTRPWANAAQELIPEFEKMTGIKVNWVIMDGWELRAKVLREYTLGSPTMDAWFYHPGQQELWMHPYNIDQMEFIEDPTLTPQDWDFNDFLPMAKVGNRVYTKDGPYSLTFGCQTTAFAYRKDLFEKYGITVPRTFDEVELAAQQIKKGLESDGVTDVFPWIARGNGFESMTRIAGYIYGYGGAWWTHDRKSAIDKPETLKGIGEYARMLREYGPPSPAELTWLEKARIFADGKAAMGIIAAEHAGMFEDPEKSSVAGKVGWAPYPAGPAGRALNTELWSVSIPKKANNPKAAWLFVQWLSNKENSKFALSKGEAVVRLSAWEDPNAKKANEEWAQVIQLSLAKGSDYFSNVICAALAEVREHWGATIDYAISGKPGLEEFARKSAEEIDKIIERAEAGMEIYVDPRANYMPYDNYR